MQKPKKPIEYHYTFTFENGLVRKFDVTLDPHSLALHERPHENLPDWTKLSFRQCDQCTLTEDMTKYCPVAANLVDLINVFGDVVSFEKAHVRIDANDRTYMRETDVQKGVSSLMGIYTVTSGCPILSRLRPMVRYHLPFATLEETMYRIVSMYLVEQYFHMRRGGAPDWELDGLAELFHDILEVNNRFMERFHDLKLKDSNINAMVILEIFSSFMTFSLESDNLSKIDYLFNL